MGHVVAGAGKPRRRGTAYSRRRVCVPRGTAEHLGSTRFVLHRATARVAGGTRVIAGGSPAGLRADKYRTLSRDRKQSVGIGGGPWHPCRSSAVRRSQGISLSCPTPVNGVGAVG